jgi:hypothetical protein
MGVAEGVLLAPLFEFEVFIREKRDWSSDKLFIPPPVETAAGGTGLLLFSLVQGFETVVLLVLLLFLPIPKPGTDTPAFPSLPIADVFNPPKRSEVGAGLTASYDGGGEMVDGATSVDACRTGRRGGGPRVCWAG